MKTKKEIVIDESEVIEIIDEEKIEEVPKESVIPLHTFYRG